MSSERDEFRKRLRLALQNAGHDSFGPTELARHFNRLFPGKPVSAHAARKWLLGEAIPTQAKIRILSAWLGVPANWLRFGESATPNAGALPDEKIDPALLGLAHDIQRLDLQSRRLILKLVRIIVHLNAPIKK